ncbi:hypothetical protein Acr_22g0000200 [Actinidia rufa]|uniref:Uncharacterized protein n=1 Tax=Actinidia rufa TaxID=165716 RepID=A0A7J0GIQ7_9ERIC|nr:hypothetical protein Acr_22g0000200 [Actinidia rufa]
MEGLIPMVYKTLKRNKARWEYQCLSSSSSGTADRRYRKHKASNVDDYYSGLGRGCKYVEIIRKLVRFSGSGFFSCQ